MIPPRLVRARHKRIDTLIEQAITAPKTRVYLSRQSYRSRLIASIHDALQFIKSSCSRYFYKLAMLRIHCREALCLVSLPYRLSQSHADDTLM